MRKFRSALVALALAAAVCGKDPIDTCGTHVGRTQQEAFLHGRNLLNRVRDPALAVGGERTAASFSRDFGNIAVMDDAAGVIGRRNPFNLDRSTLAFVPVAGGYRAEVSSDSFDSGAMGTLLALRDDDTKPIDLPFAFRFFGAEYRQAWVNSNGSISFTRGDTDYSGSYGHFVAGPPAIAGLFTDLDPENGRVYVLSEAARLVITWLEVPLAGSARFQTFQIRLYPSGRIEAAYSGANPPDALVGITPGNFASVDLVDFAAGLSRVFAGGLAEVFSTFDAVDVITASQRFYATHEDAYDFLVFYNAARVAADQGVVAFEMTVRSKGEGYGDVAVDIGAELGSKKRLQAVLNMGPITQYPLNPNGPVPARGPTGDTPLTLLGHEAGHLWLALVSVFVPPNSLPMLGAGLAHWSFPFNSEASLLEGERIEDRGPGVLPRFRTTATVEQYSPLDQYLMGFRPPEEVPPTFVVLNSGQPLSRAPQTGVVFNGNRLDVAVGDIASRYGRRTPDSTVAQRRYRFAFVLIVPEGSADSVVAAGVEQVEQYRREFETFFEKAAGGRGFADTSLKRSVTLSLAPSAGVLEGSDGTASIELAGPAASRMTFTLRKPNNVLLAPSTVVARAGETRVTFPIFGGRAGVEELEVEPSDPEYETAFARVQVSAQSGLRVSLVSVSPLVARVEDANGHPFGGIRVNGVASAPDGTVRLESTGATPVNVAIDGVTNGPRIRSVLNGASFEPRLGLGAFASIFGENLAGATLRVNGVRIEPLYVSAEQVNFLTPGNLSPGPADVTVESAQGFALVQVRLETYAPGVFLAEQALGVVDGTEVYSSFTIYCTGLGPNLQNPRLGSVVPADISVQVGDKTFVALVASVDASGLQRVSTNAALLPRGHHDLSITTHGIRSNTVKVLVDPGR